VKDKVWPLSRGAGVTVAVLDSGVNAKLPELLGAVLPGADEVNAGGDGRTDFDEWGHGTATAAQIVGQGGGTTGYVGLAPDAKVLPVHVDTVPEIAQGIRVAVDRGAKVVTMALGDPSDMYNPVHCPPELAPAISYAIQHDVVLVASAGNSGDQGNRPEQPGSCPGVLAVGALTAKLRPWKKTQRQNYVTIAAPGADLGLVGKDGTYYEGSAGTSSAAALASAAIALIRSKNPSMPARTVVQRIFATAKPIGGKGWTDRAGYGLLDISAAMAPGRSPVPATAPNPLYDAFDRWQRPPASGASSTQAPLNASRAASRPRTSSSASATPWGLILPLAGVLIIVSAGTFLILRFRRKSS
jgi:subtilisin family serine protease